MNLQMRLVSNKKLARIQRKKFIRYQKKIVILWEQYANRERNVQQLLRARSELNSPVRLS